jgi:hypothetical protein
MSTTPQLADLLTVPSQDSVLDQEVIPELQKRSVRVTSWIVGGVYRAMAYVVALLRVNVRLAIATMVAAGFEDYAFGFSTPPPNPDGSIIDVTGWAPIIAQQRYGVVRIEASYTRRTITLTNTANVAYGPLQPGPTLMLQFPSGNRYLLDQVVTIPSSGSGGTVQATFRSEFPSNTTAGLVYNDPSDSVITLVTSNFRASPPPIRTRRTRRSRSRATASASSRRRARRRARRTPSPCASTRRVRSAMAASAGRRASTTAAGFRTRARAPRTSAASPASTSPCPTIAARRRSSSAPSTTTRRRAAT